MRQFKTENGVPFGDPILAGCKDRTSDYNCASKAFALGTYSLSG